jgi:hypothetical protein
MYVILQDFQREFVEKQPRKVVDDKLTSCSLVLILLLAEALSVTESCDCDGMKE